MPRFSAIVTFQSSKIRQAFTISEPNEFYFKREATPWHCVADVTCMQECDDVGIQGLLFCKRLQLINS
jgi:hypothetical protein